MKAVAARSGVGSLRSQVQRDVSEDREVERMTPPEKYRQEAENFRLQAAKAVLDADEAQWLKVAADWQTLAEEVDRRTQPGAPECTD